MVKVMPKDPRNSNEEERHDIPRWRRIEIMREKAELRAALGDLDAELEDYDEEVFGSDEEYVSFHEHSDEPEDELEKFDEEASTGDAFDDFEDE